MGNKIRMITVIFAIMLIAGAASATTQEIILNHSNVPILDGTQVKVIYNDVTETISVQYVAGSATVSNTVKGISVVDYELNTMVSSITPDPQNKWVPYNTPDVEADGFGRFTYGQSRPDGSDGISIPITLNMNTFTIPIPLPQNDHQATMAVHLTFNGDCSGWISDGTAAFTTNPSGCRSTQIPEFTTVALPIAAVIGLVFLFQQRKKRVSSR